MINFEQKLFANPVHSNNLQHDEFPRSDRRTTRTEHHGVVTSPFTGQNWKANEI